MLRPLLKIFVVQLFTGLLGFLTIDPLVNPVSSAENPPEVSTDQNQQDPSPNTPQTPAGSLEAPQLLPTKNSINTYDVKVIKKSKSGKLYLFESEQKFEFRAGRVLLLQKDEEDHMSIRVIRTKRDTRQFIAKKIRKYRDHEQLTLGETYLALERVAPLATDQLLDEQSQEQKRQNKMSPEKIISDEDELEALEVTPEDSEKQSSKKTSDLDAELDSGDLKKSLQEMDGSGEKNQQNLPDRLKPVEPVDPEDIPEPPSDDQDLQEGLMIDEIKTLDIHTQWLSAELGLIRNNSNYFSAGGVRYGYTVAPTVFVKQKDIQDSLALELGLYFYKAFSIETEGDGYTIIPVMGTFRYNLYFNESLALFFYGGMGASQVLIIPNSESNEATRANLAKPFPVGGIGLIFHMGPNWDFRLDAGIESYQLGLMLRF